VLSAVETGSLFCIKRKKIRWETNREEIAEECNVFQTRKEGKKKKKEKASK
jgi:hypothetical protein